MTNCSNPNPAPGDELRDQAASFLSAKYGPAKTELRAMGKKVDVFFEYREFGKSKRIYVEAKDYEKRLGRAEVVHIKSDYEGIIKNNAPATLLIVTRAGLSTDAQVYVEEEIAELTHQTIWDIETGSIDLEHYLNMLAESPKETSLDKYYIEGGFGVRKSSDPKHDRNYNETVSMFDNNQSCYSQLLNWIQNVDDCTPVAILGGYGSGKTSLATMIAAVLSQCALRDPTSRRPILLRLGGFSQYSNLEGLLGSYFTNENPIANFNCHNFLKLNKTGRFVILLDGFDEMKHSMTWADFKLQVKDLLRLHSDCSKIILLGRPSAFLSETEERHILKGERRVGESESWVKLPDWPHFHELQLTEFSEEQRVSFIEKYLFATASNLSQDERENRADIANQIADNDVKLYRKPVHSKILTDLATDPTFDLEQFRERSSRWLLYSEFVLSLYSRETEKTARSDISIGQRTSFLRELCFWLWSEKGTQISFAVPDIPRQIFNEIAIDPREEIEPLCRELLSGSILERKKGDIFFFGHRSFAEFLVADRMLKVAPNESDHKKYSRAYSDGVREFIEDAKNPVAIGDWYKTFGAADGKISQTYIELLSSPHKRIDEFCSKLSPSSCWKSILSPFPVSLQPGRANFQNVLNSLSSCNTIDFSWRYCWLSQFDNETWSRVANVSGRGTTQFDTAILTCLFNSFFGSLQDRSTTLFVESEHVGFRRICDRAIRIYEFDERAEFSWSHNRILMACQTELKRIGIEWEVDLQVSEREITTNTDQFFSNLKSSASNNFLTFLRQTSRWSGITEIASKRSRRREVTPRSKPMRKFRAPNKGRKNRG